MKGIDEPFEIGDKVSRIENSIRLEGHITRKYSLPAVDCGGVTIGPYPELYDVQWVLYGLSIRGGNILRQGLKYEA